MPSLFQKKQNGKWLPTVGNTPAVFKRLGPEEEPD